MWIHELNLYSIGLLRCHWGNHRANDCPNIGEVTLKDMDKFQRCQTTTNHSKPQQNFEACAWYLRCTIFQLTLWSLGNLYAILNMQFSILFYRSFYGNAHVWMSLDFTGDKSTLVQVMAWCLRQLKLPCAYCPFIEIIFHWHLVHQSAPIVFLSIDSVNIINIFVHKTPSCTAF